MHAAYGPRHVRPHHDVPGGRPHPLPPHMVRELAAGLFGPAELAALVRLFSDQQTAERVFEVLNHAPPEFAVLAAVLLRCRESAAAG